MDDAIYLKGTADLWCFDIANRNLVGYTNKLDTSTLNTSFNDGEIRAGLGAPVVINIPDSASFTGEVNSADFSLEARALQTGGKTKYNGRVMVRETIKGANGKLVVSRTPVAAYGESEGNENFSCYVDSDKTNYGVDPVTKEVQGFAAEDGKEYCVLYFIEAASAQELAIPAAMAPKVVSMIIRLALFKAQGNSAMNGSLYGYLYVHIPRAQFTGDVSIDGSQTSPANTPWSFKALKYEDAKKACSDCSDDGAVLGYMVVVPCGDVTQSVQALAVSGGEVVLAPSEKKQIPVLFIMPGNEAVKPDYATLDFTIKTGGESYISVSDDGIVTGTSEGETEVIVSLKERPEVKTYCNVTVEEA